jgi:hypothetical protein
MIFHFYFSFLELEKNCHAEQKKKKEVVTFARLFITLTISLFLLSKLSIALKIFKNTRPTLTFLW